MTAKGLHRRQAGLSFKRVLSAVFVIAVLGFWTMRHANFVLGRALYLAFPADDTTYRAAWPSLTGTVTAKDVVFPALEGSGLQPFRFEEVTVEVPTWQYLRSAFSRRRGSMLNAINEVRITLKGGSGEYGQPFTAMLGAFGAASASPFEADGCAGDSLWSSAELRDMGLQPGPTELVVHYKRDRETLILEEDLHTPGVASVSYRGRMQMNDNYSLFSLLDGGKNAVTADSWSLADEGFVAARNRYCAGKDKITPAQFADRHIAAVQRLLASAGLRANADMAAAYRDYATNGGKLDISVEYQPALTAERYADPNVGSWLAQLQGRFSLNGKALPFGLESRAVQPLPEADEDADYALNTLAVLQAEGADPVRNGTAGLRATAPVETAAALAGSAATGIAAPGGVAATSASGATTPAAPPAVAATANAARPAAAAPATSSFLNDPPLPASARPAAPASVAAIVPAATAMASPAAGTAAAPAAAPPPIVASARGGADTSLPDNYVPAGTRVDYAQLGKMVGQYARVYMKTRPPMQGLVVKEEKGVVYLRRHLGSGYAVLQIDKAAFDYAESMN
ncbi:hypothetical protein [Tahibacter harae]|uniref:Uncharacterized protein n=1 Tax=Tahibacter harae TaxID=2963937 RepID=A0ABT1QTN7_9GAMM|nr:hypothetical protein [Tahibacter harae]MCQ4165650.1 hypothetical protein [Tahibacter harae]